MFVRYGEREQALGQPVHVDWTSAIPERGRGPAGDEPVSARPTAP